MTTCSALGQVCLYTKLIPELDLLNDFQTCLASSWMRLAEKEV
jgi:hypothetical protein